ncbi:MAG TPA: acetyl-CoA acetyltransferase, partial [Methylomirabilota bacterium]|nr:acetyl-CoA acetyltransferase [Methylomirabilota bacterium]
SYKELIFEAALEAYADAGVDPRSDVDSFVCSSEDFLEGTSIFDEYVPDQLGAILKPVCTISADGMYSLITAYMQILTGVFDVVAVEAHSKASDIVNLSAVYDLALDPIFNRPLQLDARFVAGLEMAKYLHLSGARKEHCRRVVEKNRSNAIQNSLAMRPTSILPDDTTISDPLTTTDAAPLADGAVVLVLASEQAAKDLRDDPVWISGVGWASDSPSLETRDWSIPQYAGLSAKQAYKLAKIRNPSQDIEVVEVDDTYSYKELQHMEALNLAGDGKAHKMLDEGYFDAHGPLPVNPSGGSIGMGHTLEMSGLLRVVEMVLQLRGQAGAHQVNGAHTGLAQCWRGIPSASGAAIVLES